LTFAYDVPAERFADVPEWVMSEQFDAASVLDREEMNIAPGMTSDQVEGVMSRQRRHMQAILRDRFGLVLREESRELPFYALRIAEGGPKLTPAAKDFPGGASVSGGLLGLPRQLTAKGAAGAVLVRRSGERGGRTQPATRLERIRLRLQSAVSIC
jgi:uncharacterized protein (TIGR03435 family)